MFKSFLIFSCFSSICSANIISNQIFDRLFAPKNAEDQVYFSISDVTVIVDQTEEFLVHQRTHLQQDVTLTFEVDHVGNIEFNPRQVQLGSGALNNSTVTILGLKSGSLILSGISSPDGVISDEDLFVRVTVAISRPLIYVSITIGWIYFVAWSVSFYPQCWTNFRRKSVVGLSFDYLGINVVGHTMYALFNSALYWIPVIQDEYFERYPRGQNPVKLNDVVFALHASALTIFTIGQCFIYERGTQRVSWKSWSIIGIFGIAFFVTLILAATGVMAWLDFLYTCSYIKLAVTLTKYIPQMYLNFVRKSTVGWSITAVLLDFSGGVLSMLQMILDAANFDDWASIFGDPTKFWLGALSVGFSVVFIIQHYWLYRDASKCECKENV